ncbi:hypothetical protein LCGC14_1726810 [marine sediment metagenome]|uniref:Fibronectin type-III domain-containing protein n=1 Tax=marine sediment metagenome TaxID=412755 RepID=A0A0F9HAJ4_9ZZZZ
MKKKLYISLGVVAFLLVSIFSSSGIGSRSFVRNNPKLAGTSPVLKPIIPSPNFDGRIELRWDKIYGVYGYSIYQTDPSGVTIRLERNWRGNSYSVSGLTDGVWQFQLRNVYMANFGEFGNIESIQVGNVPTPTPTPTPINTTINTTMILLISGMSIIGVIVIIWLRGRK